MLYVPILKAKLGEKKAVLSLFDSTKDKITPLFEVPKDHLEKCDCTFYEKDWVGRNFYLDFPHEIIQNGLSDKNFYAWFSTIKKEFLIPVLHLCYDSSRVKQILSITCNGIAIRLTINEIFSDSFIEDYKIFTSNLKTDEVDLIIDAQELDGDQFNKELSTLKNAIKQLPNLTSYRNVIFTSGSFPKTLQVDKDELILLARSETKFFNAICTSFPNTNFIYSDYCVNHWDFFEYIIGMSVSFNIRYTVDDYYLIFKGKTAKKEGFNIVNVKAACKKLVKSSYYSGKDFSEGDAMIYSISDGTIKKGGNPTTWRMIGTNHHIEFIINLLSSQL